MKVEFLKPSKFQITQHISRKEMPNLLLGHGLAMAVQFCVSVWLVPSVQLVPAGFVQFRVRIRLPLVKPQAAMQVLALQGVQPPHDARSEIFSGIF